MSNKTASPDIRACATPQELHDAIAPIWHYFGYAPTAEAVDNFSQLITPARMLSLREDGETVAGCGSFPFDLTTPGGRAKTAGVTMVGVMPTHRRRGLLTAMMRRLLDDCRARGEAVASLWASDERIYGQFGFGLAGHSADVHVMREHADFVVAPPEGVRVRRLQDDDRLAPMAAVYDRVAATTPGLFQRSEDWWRRRILADPAWRRRGGGELQAIIAEIDGAPQAYALYRINMDGERGAPKGGCVVVESMGDAPAAHAAIWRYLLTMDWTAWIKADFLPLDHPLPLMAREPRRLNLRLRDGCWTRLVDVGAALAARAYGPAQDVVIEVEDAFCPWNAGRWRVGASGVARTEAQADLACDAAALASVYLGGFTWRELVAACRATAVDAAAILRADRVFERSAAPACPEIF